MTDEKPKHKPQKKRTLEEVLKSLQDLIRTDLISPPAARKFGHLTSERQSGEPASADEPETFQAALHKLNEVITEKIIEPIERAQETPLEPLLPDEELEIEWNDTSAAGGAESAIEAIESIELSSPVPEEEIEIQALAPDAAPPAQPDVELETSARLPSEPATEVSAAAPEPEPRVEPEAPAPAEQPALEPVELHVEVQREAPPAPSASESSAELPATSPESQPSLETDVPAPLEAPIVESVEIETAAALEAPSEETIDLSETEGLVDVTDNQQAFDFSAPVQSEPPEPEPAKYKIDEEQTKIPATIEASNEGAVPLTDEARTVSSVAERKKPKEGPALREEQPNSHAVESKGVDDAFTVEFTVEPKAPEPARSTALKTGTDVKPRPPKHEQAATADAGKRPEGPIVKKEPPSNEPPDRAPKKNAPTERESPENAPGTSNAADNTPPAEGDIPVLKDVADLQAPPSPPLPDASQARDIAIRVIAKLNIERRKVGEKPLDIKTIERLQQYLADALSKRALNKLK